MRLTYDERAGAAYLRLRDETIDAGKVTSATFRPPGSTAADDYFVLNFDDAGWLLGIEFLTPEARLPPDALAAAERLPHRAP